jgi:hypothetical protein
MQSTKRALQCEGRGVETVEGAYFIPPFVIGRAAALNSESKEQPCLYKPFFSGVFRWRIQGGGMSLRTAAKRSIWSSLEL